MNFQSLAFLGFFIISAPLCLLARRKSLSVGVAVLLLASVIAYGDIGVATLCLGIGVTYGVSRVMVTGNHSKPLLTLGICYHVAVLTVFKYLGFFTAGAFSLSWVPVGISFFTFSQIWYLKEVYTGTFTPVTLGKLGLYGLFFPTVVSGPILSPKAFFPQLEGEGFLRPTVCQWHRGLVRFSLGLVKKILLADQLALLVTAGYDSPATLTTAAAWVAMVGFALQLYLDFSGYCDMAIGVGLLLGMELPENFNIPYRATSITDFWQRWHITLTSFLRQCVYLPLGGNRKGAGRTYVHIILVFIISGLWHGAGWTFLLWGLLHGLAQVIERSTKSVVSLPKWAGWTLTFGFVVLAWVPFRAATLSDALTLLTSGFGVGTGTTTVTTMASLLYPTELTALLYLFPAYDTVLPLVVMALLLLASLWVSLAPVNHQRLSDQPWKMLLLGLVVGWCILSFGGGTSFLYANF